MNQIKLLGFLALLFACIISFVIILDVMILGSQRFIFKEDIEFIAIALVIVAYGSTMCIGYQLGKWVAT